MKKNNIYIFRAIAILFAAAILFSCTHGFDDINKDPYGVTTEEAARDAYAEGASLIAMQAWVVPTQPNAAQFTECLMGGSWGGYFADSNPGFNGKNFATYRPEPGWNRVMYTDIIPKVYPSLAELKNSTDNEVTISIGEVIKVAAVHRVTDAYGPIPYSKIGEDGELKAPLDAQKDIYTKMLEELTEAVDILTPHRTEFFSADADKVFGGSVMKWIKFANSLKLRLSMRLAYADATLAQQMAEEAVNHEVGVMTNNSESAFIAGFGKDGNPLHRIMYLWNDGDSRVSADITAYMTGMKDPRASKYFTESTFTAEDNVGQNGFFGLRSGINIPASKEAQKYSNYNVTPSTPILWMNAAEVAFLKAEGKLRGWNTGEGSAQDLYEEGIRLSFDQYSADGVDAYLSNTSNKPASYQDPLGNNSYSGAISTITSAWDESEDFETNLEQIITQKWIAIFPLGIEAWAEQRRTGYPKLMPVVINGSNGAVDSSIGPRRLAYPAEEISTNGANLQHAISEYLRGPDNMGTKVWWDKK